MVLVGHVQLSVRRMDEELHVVVADFGLSRDVYDSHYYSSSDKQAKLPIKWMAPESLEKNVYNTKTDVVRQLHYMCALCSSYMTGAFRCHFMTRFVHLKILYYHFFAGILSHGYVTHRRDDSILVLPCLFCCCVCAHARCAGSGRTASCCGS